MHDYFVEWNGNISIEKNQQNVVGALLKFLADVARAAPVKGQGLNVTVYRAQVSELVGSFTVSEQTGTLAISPWASSNNSVSHYQRTIGE